MPIIFSRFEVSEEEGVSGLYCSFTSRRVLEFVFQNSLCFPFNSSVFSQPYVSQLTSDPSRSPCQLRASSSEFNFSVSLWLWSSENFYNLANLIFSDHRLSSSHSDFLRPLWLSVRAMSLVPIDLCDHRSADIFFPLYSHKLYVLNFMSYILGLGSSIFFHCSHRFFHWLLDFLFIFKHNSYCSWFCSSASSSLPSFEILAGKSFHILSSSLPYDFHTWCQQNIWLTRLVINYISQSPIWKGAKWAATSVSLRISVLVSLTKYKAIKWLHSFQWVNSVLKAKVYFFFSFS